MLDASLVWITVITLVAILLFFRQKKKQKLPPGPLCLPFFGYYPFLGKEPFKVIAKLCEKYGNVIGLYVGPQYVVVLNDWKALVDAYDQSHTIDRPLRLFADAPYKLGVAGVNRPEWNHIRRLVAKTLKDAMHKTGWEEMIQQEVSEIVERIRDNRGKPIDVRQFFSETFANNVLTMGFGERFPAGHPLLKLVARAVDLIIEHSPTLGMTNFSTKLQKILELLGIEEKSDISNEVQNFVKFITEEIEKQINDSGTEDSFTSQLHRELQASNNNPDVKEMLLKGTIAVLLTGGAETSRTTVIFTLMALADHPEVQKKVQEELDMQLGQTGSIKWSDRSKIPYTLATFLESMRWRTVVPLTTMRIASDDFKVQGYDIPKGTNITCNAWAIHNDPRYWDEPEKFIPERFLLEDGRKVNTEAISFTPFSYGKRNCVGKLMALMGNIQYIIALMQHFTVVSSDGGKLKYDTLFGLTYQACNFKLRFVPRH